MDGGERVELFLSKTVREREREQLFSLSFHLSIFLKRCWRGEGAGPARAETSDPASGSRLTFFRCSFSKGISPGRARHFQKTPPEHQYRNIEREKLSLSLSLESFSSSNKSSLLKKRKSPEPAREPEGKRGSTRSPRSIHNNKQTKKEEKRRLSLSYIRRGDRNHKA